MLFGTDIKGVSPSASHPIQQRAVKVRHPCIVDADIHASLLLLDAVEHGQYVLFFGQVTVHGMETSLALVIFLQLLNFFLE